MIINTLRTLGSVLGHGTKHPRTRAMPTLRHSFAIQKNPVNLELASEGKQVLDINNGCIYFKDHNNEFPFMHEFVTDSNQKGVVVSILDKYSAGVLYQKDPNISKISPTHQKAQEFTHPLYYHNIYDINGQTLHPAEEDQPIKFQNFKVGNLRVSTHSPSQINTHNPLIDLCYPLFQGDFKILKGSKGSGKLEFLKELMSSLLKQNHKVIYFNLNKNQCMKMKKMSGDWIAFTESGNEQPAGGLFLALKMVRLAEKLVSEGNNVLVIMENVPELLSKQVTLFKNFNQPMAPFSVINTLYDLSGKLSQNQATLTTILTTQDNQGSNTSESSTSYCNSMRHLESLAYPISFPLQIRRTHIPSTLSEHINKLLQQQNEIKQKKLFKIPVDPYDYYYSFDSSWWVKSLSKFKTNNKYTLELFYNFIGWNIRNDYVSQWEIGAEKAFQKFRQFIDPGTEMFIVADQEKMEVTFQEFLLDSRIKGDFSPFKKDYM